jgi:hypothetical protein
MEKQATDMEKIFETHILIENSYLMYRIAKLYSKARNIPIRKWAEDIK